MKATNTIDFSVCIMPVVDAVLAVPGVRNAIVCAIGGPWSAASLRLKCTSRDCKIVWREQRFVTRVKRTTHPWPFPFSYDPIIMEGACQDARLVVMEQFVGVCNRIYGSVCYNGAFHNFIILCDHHEYIMWGDATVVGNKVFIIKALASPLGKNNLMVICYDIHSGVYDITDHNLIFEDANKTEVLKAVWVDRATLHLRAVFLCDDTKVYRFLVEDTAWAVNHTDFLDLDMYPPRLTLSCPHEPQEHEEEVEDQRYVVATYIDRPQQQLCPAEPGNIVAGFGALYGSESENITFVHWSEGSFHVSVVDVVM